MDTNRDCIYCHLEVKPHEPYSMRKMGDSIKYWHYKCYVNNSKGTYELSENERKDLVGLVLEATGGNADGLALLALRSIGYGK